MRRARSVVSLLVLTFCFSTTPAVVDARLEDASARKAALKCQQALLNAAARFFKKELAALAKCSNKSVECVHNPDPAKRAECLGKLAASNPCNETLKKVLTPLQSEFGTTVASACNGLDPSELTDAAGLGFGLLDPECSSIGFDASDAGGIIECLGRVYRRSIERLFAIQAPRTRELFQATGIDVTGLRDLPGYKGCQGCSVTPGDPEQEKA